MKIYISSEKVYGVNIQPLAKYYPELFEEMKLYEPRPREHYHLLCYLAGHFQKRVLIDGGTLYGMSALSMALGHPSNHVFTYDIRPCTLPFKEEHSNVTFVRQDISKVSSHILKETPLILLDVDPHDGYQERVFVKRLQELNYDGLVVCDDIHLNDAMRNWWSDEDFWSEISAKRYDVSHCGHHSGTGILDFSEDSIVLE